MRIDITMHGSPIKRCIMGSIIIRIVTIHIVAIIGGIMSGIIMADAIMLIAVITAIMHGTMLMCVIIGMRNVSIRIIEFIGGMSMPERRMAVLGGHMCIR